MTAAVAKTWFRKNPLSIVVFHRLWESLPQSSRELMSSPRMARVAGHHVTFSPHQSVVTLTDVDACLADNGDLELHFGGAPCVTYRAAPEVVS